MITVYLHRYDYHYRNYNKNEKMHSLQLWTVTADLNFNVLPSSSNKINSSNNEDNGIWRLIIITPELMVTKKKNLNNKI